MKFKINIDGVPFEFEASESAQAALTQRLSKSDEEIASLKARADKVDEDAAAALKARADELTAEKARADAAEEKVAELEKARQDAASPEAIEKAVAERLTLVETARKIVGDEFKADGKSADDIKREVVLKVSPGAREKLDANDSAYLSARFDQAVESNAVKTSRDSNGSVRKAAADHADAGEVIGLKLDSARQEYKKRQDQMWQQPLSASKDTMTEARQ